MKATTKKIWFFYPARCNAPPRLLNNLFLSSRFLTTTDRQGRRRRRLTTTTAEHKYQLIANETRHSFSHRVVVAEKGSGHNILFWLNPRERRSLNVVNVHCECRARSGLVGRRIPSSCVMSSRLLTKRSAAFRPSPRPSESLECSLDMRT